MCDPLQEINEIDAGLYLSSRRIAETESILRANEITHILTIDTWPIRRQVFSRPDDYAFHYLCKNDEENVDLLSHFEECNEFIRKGGRVLVHCYVGVSRSATIVLAHLMNKYKITYEDALGRVMARRKVSPNDGFVAQLKLYERMGFELDKRVHGCVPLLLHCFGARSKGICVVAMRNQRNFSQCRYRLLYLTSVASQVGSYRGFLNLPEEDQQKINSVLTVTDLDIRCRHCRWPLASSNCILPHEDRRDVTWRTILEDLSQNEEKRKTRRCGEEFILPAEKMMAQCAGLAGKIYCPKCTNKVGRFAWMGLYCDCGAMMKPGFVLSTSKIDQKLVELPLQEGNS